MELLALRGVTPRSAAQVRFGWLDSVRCTRTGLSQRDNRHPAGIDLEILSHKDSIQLIKSLGAKFTPELKGPNRSATLQVEDVFGSQEGYAQAMIDEYKEAAEKLTSSAGAPECVWTGRRIESLLWRDDIDTARRYIDLYDRFGCSSEHLKLAFRCIIQQGPIDPKAADKLASRVHNCWIAPEEATTASSQATTGATSKDGTIPN